MKVGRKVRLGETPRPARETRALPRVSFSREGLFITPALHFSIGCHGLAFGGDVGSDLFAVSGLEVGARIVGRSVPAGDAGREEACENLFHSIGQTVCLGQALDLRFAITGPQNSGKLAVTIKALVI